MPDVRDLPERHGRQARGRCCIVIDAPERTSTRARVKYHADGTPYVRPYIGTSRVTGKPMRPYHRLPKGLPAEELQRMADEWVRDQDVALRYGTVIRLEDYLEDFISHREYAGPKGKRITESTAKTWRMFKRNYLLKLGKRDPRTITTRDVNNLLFTLAHQGGRQGNPLSPTTLMPFYQFLRSAFRWIESNGVETQHPLEGAEKPALVEADESESDDIEFRALSMTGLMVITGALERELATEPTTAAGVGRRVDAFATWLMLHTGVRVGEACAIRRMDLHLEGDNPYVTVCGTVVDAGGLHRQPFTKGKKVRTVALSKLDVPVIEAHLAWQDGLLGGRRNKRTLVSANGGLRSPNTVNHGLTAIVRDCGLPKGVTSHTMRRTHATHLLRAGVSVKDVQKRLGHADPSTTLRHYAQALPDGKAMVADAFAEITRGLPE